jgi:F-type H+-transporting ATPase subunit alpha
VARRSLPAIQTAVRQLHVTPTAKAAEISSILEERILGAAPKVNFLLLIYELKLILYL